MTELETLRDEYEKYGLTRFRDYYGIGVSKVYEAFGQSGQQGWTRSRVYPEFVLDGSSVQDRREKFYRITGLTPVRRGGRTKEERMEWVREDTVQKVERFKETYIAPEKYEGRFSFAFHRF